MGDFFSRNWLFLCRSLDDRGRRGNTRSRRSCGLTGDNMNLLFSFPRQFLDPFYGLRGFDGRLGLLTKSFAQQSLRGYLSPFGDDRFFPSRSDHFCLFHDRLPEKAKEN
ncbi:hypothetical protein ACFX1S_046602 [Malus domestica]